MELLNDILAQVGLTEEESLIFNTLLSNGALTVLEISQKAGVKRTNLYNLLTDLEKKNLVKKVTAKSTTKYFPLSPNEIKNLLDRKMDQLNAATNTFEILLNTLQTQYNLVSHKPVITYYEGLQGLQKVYDDILATGVDIDLMRSTYDDKRKDVDKLIQKQIKEQVKRNIHARIVGPAEADAKELYTKYDKIRLVEERFLTKFPFNIPAQIIIYGNKTAIATVRKDIIITLIDNTDITNTFKVLFEFVWEYSKPQHDELVKTWN